MSTLDVTNLKSKLALTPPKFYDKDDKEIGTLCRAWVNFNGIGVVAIRDSFNVSSITDNNTGDYSVNFTNAMPDANYSYVVSVSPNAGVAWAGSPQLNHGMPDSHQAPTVNRCRFLTGAAGTLDNTYVNVAVFR